MREAVMKDSEKPFNWGFLIPIFVVLVLITYLSLIQL